MTKRDRPATRLMFERVARLLRRAGIGNIGIAAAAMFMCTAVPGCTALSSDTPESFAADGRPLEGVAYALPLYVMDFVLSVNPDSATFSVKPSEPRAIAASGHRYYLRYHPLPNYDDAINITVTGQGFLKSVTSNTTDRSGDIILNLVKSVTAFGPAFEAAPASPGEVQLTKLTVDPTNGRDLASLVNAFNGIIRNYAKSQSFEGNPACKGKKLDKPEPGNKTYYPDIHGKSLCDEYSSIASRDGYKQLVDIRLKRLSGTLSQALLTPPDCSAGLCYRPPMPYELKIGVRGSETRSVVLLPNEAPMVGIDIQRAFFINKVQTVEFDDNGTLKSMAVTKDSELLAISAFPIQVVSAIAESLRLRVSVLDNQIANANSTRELIQAKSDLEKQRVLFERASNQATGRANATTSASSVLSPAAPAAAGQAASFLNKQVALPGRTQ